MKTFRLTGILLLMLSLVISCGGSSDSGDNGDDDDTTETTSGLRLVTAGDFDSSASQASLLFRAARVTTGQCLDLEAPITQDDPILEDGLDCDADGGLVAHVTPTQYFIAFKRVSLLGSDGNTSDIELVADTGTLANSEVVEFTENDSSESLVTINPDDLAAGTYSGVEGELYYFELTFPVAGSTRRVRIYMSDDDFPEEGNLGHHQGDITFIDENGDEEGWIDSTWTATATERGEEQNGAGGVDPETGHDRGFFGNEDLWNQDSLQQGPNEDLYVMELDFDDPLEIPDPSEIDDLTTITLTFSVADTFFYEDFAPQNTAEFPGFYPANGGEATAEEAAWAPLAPTATLTVE